VQQDVVVGWSGVALGGGVEVAAEDEAAGLERRLTKSFGLPASEAALRVCLVELGGDTASGAQHDVRDEDGHGDEGAGQQLAGDERKQEATLEDLRGCVRLRAWRMTRTRAEQNGGGGDVLAAETKTNVLGRAWRRCRRLAELVKRPPPVLTLGMDCSMTSKQSLRQTHTSDERDGTVFGRGRE
jgi:hypothetical protein